MNRTALRVVLPILVLVAGVVAAGTILALRPEPPTQSPEVLPPLVRVMQVQPEPVRLLVRTHGTVEPRAEVDVIPEVSGRIQEVSESFVSGGFVGEGDLLFRIDAVDYEIAVEQAEATLARRQSEAKLARANRDRTQTLSKSELVSPSVIDEAESAASAAAAAVREARAALERARLDLARTEIRAPFDARVRRESVAEGQHVSRGSSVGRIFATDTVEVRLPLEDEDLAHLDLPMGLDPQRFDGPGVVLYGDFAGARQQWRGQIVRTEGALDPESRMVIAVARVEDPYNRDGGAATTTLPVGLFVEAEILGRRIAGAFRLPRRVMRGPDSLLVVSEDERLRFREVEVAQATESTAVITAGLAAGERVCISPLEAPTEGMQVRVAAPDEVDPSVPAPSDMRVGAG